MKLSVSSTHTGTLGFFSASIDENAIFLSKPYKNTKSNEKCQRDRNNSIQFARQNYHLEKTATAEQKVSFAVE